MYCVNCGVELADTERRCPLCAAEVCHPAGKATAEPLYPAQPGPGPGGAWAGMLVLTVLYLLPAAVVLLCDWGDKRLDWAGLALGGMGLAYLLFLLPHWFRRPSPAVFVPCGFAGAGLYLWYIAFSVGGHWFWPFALPVTLGFGLWATTLSCLLFYLKKGRLFVLGGGALMLAAFMPALELLIGLNFFPALCLSWSLYPAAALGILGMLLLFLGICRPAREALERRFFF